MYNTLAMSRNFDLKRFAREILSLGCYFCLALSSGNYIPFSIALLCANLYVGFNPIKGAILCFLPFLLSLSPTVILIGAWGCAVVATAFLALAKVKRKPTFEIVFICLFACLPYAVFTDFYPTALRFALTLTVIPLCFVFISAVKVWAIKGLRYKLSGDEELCAAFLYCFVGYGAIIALGADFWRLGAIFACLFFSSVAPDGKGIVFTLVSSLPLSLADFSFTPIAQFSLYALIISLWKGKYRLLAAISFVALDLAFFYFTDVYKDRSLYGALLVIIPVCLYLFIPKKVFDKVAENIRIYRMPSIGRYAVNRTRTALSGKLYEMAAVFDEMYKNVKNAGQLSPDAVAVKHKIAERIKSEGCADCGNRDYCEKRDLPSSQDLYKAVSIGFEKGKMNIVDLPKSMASYCIRSEYLARYGDNLIRENQNKMREITAVDEGKELALCQTEGMSEALKSLAFSMSRQSEINSPLEKKVYENLVNCGIYPAEIVVFGSGSDVEINITLSPQETEKDYFLKAIDEITGYKSVISSRTNISDKLSAITIRPRPKFDAVFGISQKTKNGESKSGDTHSVTKISEGKFLIALNDGMGSGERAQSTSSTAISMIETFYKAGLSSKVVLNTVNKILSFSKEDNFTAADIGVIDLFEGNADFIKIGSPYSFVITKDSVKIVEGNSLPLGIMDEVKPTTLKTSVSDGDTVVFTSDGISDAFGSASDLVDFLSVAPTSNPKALADDILNRAMILSNGIAKDDMTVLCVKIFK